MEIIRSSFLKMRQGFHRRPDRQKAEGLIIVVNQSPKRLELCKEKKWSIMTLKGEEELVFSQMRDLDARDPHKVAE